MPPKDAERTRLAEILRELRRLSIAGDEAGAIALVRSLCLPEAILLLNDVGLDRWDADKQKVVARSAKEWKAMPQDAAEFAYLMSSEVYAELLLVVAPRLYAEPESPPQSARPRVAKRAVKMMASRKRDNLGLRHPGDDVFLLDREKRFVGTINDHEPDATGRAQRKSNRVHLDRSSRPDQYHEAG